MSPIYQTQHSKTSSKITRFYSVIKYFFVCFSKWVVIETILTVLFKAAHFQLTAF